MRLLPSIIKFTSGAGGRSFHLFLSTKNFSSTHSIYIFQAYDLNSGAEEERKKEKSKQENQKNILSKLINEQFMRDHEDLNQLICDKIRSENYRR